MPTATLKEKSVPTQTDYQRIRVTSIKFSKSPEFACTYQVSDGIDWSKPLTLVFNRIFTDGKLSAIETLKEVIFRVFETEATWGHSQVKIKGISVKYCIKDKEEKDGLEWTVGQPKSLSLEGGFYSQWLSNPDISLGTIEQYISPTAIGEVGCLTKQEGTALQELLNIFADAIASELNRKVDYKAEQLKLF